MFGVMRPDPVLVPAAVAFAGASAFGSAVSVRHDIPGQPLGVSIPLSVPAGLLVGWGAGVAAPWPMPLTALIAAAWTCRAERGVIPGVMCMVLGIGCIVGTLVEPVTYQPRTWVPAVSAAIVGNVVASATLAAAGRRALHKA